MKNLKFALAILFAIMGMYLVGIALFDSKMLIRGYALCTFMGFSLICISVYIISYRIIFALLAVLCFIGVIFSTSSL